MLLLMLAQQLVMGHFMLSANIQNKISPNVIECPKQLSFLKHNLY